MSYVDVAGTLSNPVSAFVFFLSRITKIFWIEDEVSTTGKY